ncbi:uncharacterized protein N7458_002887 [Penicillium daleae]|uniref:Uncharacterized protein n=1 Tax=Penicillium daleae TaxID=63821 RepID=A0AAD6G783_9EURO|nr:uncharacterized protein N7458_002887 [Penicillium daleae]KAJ5461335.1 hypothetical protein N7458_002887 [Penicillium daleae]
MAWQVDGTCSTGEFRVLRRPRDPETPQGQKPTAHGPKPCQSENQTPNKHDQRVTAEGGSRWRAKPNPVDCAAEVWGNNPISPHELDTISSVHDAMDGAWRDPF